MENNDNTIKAADQILMNTISKFRLEGKETGNTNEHDTVKDEKDSLSIKDPHIAMWNHAKAMFAWL